ncbi:hypothetical protein LINPERHAP1_LOCUS20759 [Linum perenne]
MATGGEKPETSDPATTSAGGNHKAEKSAASSSSSSESSWGEPVEKSSPPTDDPEAYRIPSEVFSRTKSSTPQEWSVASNESLFSIQMGNMSFTKDQAFLMEKSAELGYDPNYPMGLGPMASPMREHRPPKTNASSPSPKSEETTSSQLPAAQPKSGGSGLGESKENGNHHDTGRTAGHLTQVTKNPSFESTSFRRSSNASGTSVKSFAFPILTGEADRSQPSHSHQATPQTAQQEAATTKSDQDNNNDQSTQPETAKSADNKGNNQNGTAGGGSKWFSCFPCCPSRAS